MPDRVYRVQDWQGRGPFKPGLSEAWLDPVLSAGKQDLAPFNLLAMASLIIPGWHYGCACRTLADLGRWFSPSEQQRLALLGYRLVALRADRIVMDDGAQVLIARRRPLRKGVVTIAWDDAAQAAAEPSKLAIVPRSCPETEKK